MIKISKNESINPAHVVCVRLAEEGVGVEIYDITGDGFSVDFKTMAEAKAYKKAVEDEIDKVNYDASTWYPS